MKFWVKSCVFWENKTWISPIFAWMMCNFEGTAFQISFQEFFINYDKETGLYSGTS